MTEEVPKCCKAPGHMAYISFYGKWDTQPPAHFSGSDYGTSSGIGWTVGNK